MGNGGDEVTKGREGVVAFWDGAERTIPVSVRVLAVLASEADAMHTSSAIAEALKESAVMVRRTFLLLHKAGLIEQKRGRMAGRS